MTDQLIILLFLIAGTGITLFLYVWKAKKEIEYKKDERWQTIQNKANHTANFSNYVLIIIILIGDIIQMNSDIEIMLTLNRVLTYALLFVALRNAIELLALKYFDRQL